MRKRLLAMMPMRMPVLLFAIFNAFELCVLLLSLVIYTTPFKAFPWYETDSIALLAIFLISPAYLLVGAFLLGLSKHLFISKMNKSLPFLAIVVLIIPIIIISDNPLHFYNWMYFGISACCVLIFGVILTTIQDSISLNKKGDLWKVEEKFIDGKPVFSNYIAIALGIIVGVAIIISSILLLIFICRVLFVEGYVSTL